MSKKLVKIIGLLLMVGLLFAALPKGQVEAATYTVNPGESIQTAIDGAGTGDTIILAAGTHTITQTINVNESITIDGEGINSTIVETAGTSTDPVSMFNVSVDNVTISDMKIQHKKTSNTSVESAIVLSNTVWPSYTPVLGFKLERCRVEFMEFAVSLRGGDWTLSDNEFVYSSLIVGGNRALGVYGTTGINIVEDNTFIGSGTTTGDTDFIYLTSSGSNETYSGTLQLIGNTQTGGNIRHFYNQDVFTGTGLTLIADGNTTTALNGNFILYAAGTVSPLDHFTSISLLNNSVSNVKGKGLLALDGDSGLKSAGSTSLTMTGNTLTNPTVNYSDWAEATGSSGGLVGYKTTIFNDPNVTITIPKPTVVYVDDGFTAATPGWGTTHFSTIQAGINAVADSGTVNIANGTYIESLNIYKSLSLIGESEAGVIIDASSFSDYSIDVDGDWTTVFRNFTLLGHSTYTSAYGLKISGDGAITTIDQVTVQGSRRSGIDLNGLNGGTVSNVTIKNSGYGVGLALTNCSNIAVSNVTTSGNAWGGMALYTDSTVHTQGSDGVSLSGTNNFGEAGKLYFEIDPDHPVTNFTQNMFFYTVINPFDRLNYTFFAVDLAEAAGIALAMPTPLKSSIEKISDGSHWVVPGMSIQAAIDAAIAGDPIYVAAGTYTENVLVNKQVSIIGAGSGTGGTIVTSPATFDSKVGVFQITGSGTSSAPLLLQDMRVQPVGQAGISVGRFTEATGQNVSYLTLGNIYVYGSYYAPATEQERGFYVDLTSTVDHLTVVDSVFTHLTYGWYLQKSVSADTSTVSNVSVTNTTFNYNAHKGIYAEKLTNAVFEDCTFDNNGSDDTVLPVYFNDWKAGVDINLKAGIYSNISFIDCVITNNGTGNAKEGVGITFKARDDGGYASFPATLTGVLVQGGTITGNERGIRIGEPGKNNAGPSDVLIENLTLLDNDQKYSGTIPGSAYGDMINMSLTQATASPVWWGSASGPATGQIYGDVLSCGWLDAAPPTGVPVAKPVVNANTSVGYCTIQDAIDDASSRDTINVAAGTYVEYVVINKNLSLIGATGATIQKPVGDVFYKLPDDGTLRTFRPVVLVYGGTITSGDGLTAATAYSIQGTSVVNVTIGGFHIDGGDAWADTTSTNWADGVLLRNVVGEISSNTIDGLVPATPTSQNYSIGIEMRGDGSDIDVLDNIVSEFGRTGIYMAGDEGTPTAYIKGNSVTSTFYGPYITNGIEIAYGSTGSIIENAVTGATGEGTIWTGTCIMLFGANNATVSGNEVSTCDVGISVGARINYGVTGLNNTISGNTIDNCTWSSIEVNTNVQNTKVLNNIITNVASRTGTEEAGIVVLEYSNPASGYPNGVLIEGNTISGAPGFWGIDIYRNADNVTIQKNTITGGDLAVALELKETNSVGKTVTISNAPGLGNKFIGQTGVQVSTGPYNYSGVIYQWTPEVPAAYNYWGTPCGPTSVSSNVDYEPWYTDVNMINTSDVAGTYHFAAGAVATEMNPVIACAANGSTFIFDGNTSGGIVVPANKVGLTFELNGVTVGAGSPAFDIFGDDIAIQGPGILDGDGSTDPGIRINDGADNPMIEEIYIEGWQNGIEVSGSHASFKVVSSWIHDNTAAGMLFNEGVTFATNSVVTIEGNLFKANGGPGINNLSTTSIPAAYNSWGDIGGPTTGDEVSGLVVTSPFTYSEIFVDMIPDTLATQVGVTEQSTFSVAVKVDAVNLYAVSYELHYNPAYLDFIDYDEGPNFDSTSNAFCDYDIDEVAGSINLFCVKTYGDEVTNVNGETISILEFKATGTGLLSNGPWMTYFDITTDEEDLSSGAIGGVKVFVNNGGFGEPSTEAGHTITDTDDGKVIITGLANYTGYIDLEGRPNDSGAVISVYSIADKATAVEMAEGTSASSGKYTTAFLSTHQLTIGSTYYLNVDAYLYLPTTVATATAYEDSAILNTRSLTSLATVLLLGGDSTNDDLIDITDVSCIGGDYNLAPDTCGTNGFSDVNGDGVVDIYDLVLSGGNVYKAQSIWVAQ